MADDTSQSGPDELRSLKSDELRARFRAAQRAAADVMADLDALGAGEGVAIELVDEARELLSRAEDTHFKATNPRSTDAVALAVELARRARAEREGG